MCPLPHTQGAGMAQTERAIGSLLSREWKRTGLSEKARQAEKLSGVQIKKLEH